MLYYDKKLKWNLNERNIRTGKWKNFDDHNKIQFMFFFYIVCELYQNPGRKMFFSYLLSACSVSVKIYRAVNTHHCTLKIFTIQSTQANMKVCWQYVQTYINTAITSSFLLICVRVPLWSGHATVKMKDHLKVHPYSP